MRILQVTSDTAEYISWHEPRAVGKEDPGSKDYSTAAQTLDNPNLVAVRSVTASC